MALLAAMCGGCTMPVMVVLFGDLTNAFVTNGINPATICESLPQCCSGIMYDKCLTFYLTFERAL